MAIPKFIKRGRFSTKYHARQQHHLRQLSVFRRNGMIVVEITATPPYHSYPVHTTLEDREVLELAEFFNHAAAVALDNIEMAVLK